MKKVSMIRTLYAPQGQNNKVHWSDCDMEGDCFQEANFRRRSVQKTSIARKTTYLSRFSMGLVKIRKSTEKNWHDTRRGNSAQFDNTKGASKDVHSMHFFSEYRPTKVQATTSTAKPTVKTERLNVHCRQRRFSGKEITRKH